MDASRRWPRARPTCTSSRGDRFVLRTSGGGGLGPARERDAARVRDDIVTGKVTPEGAARDYGLDAVTASGWVLGADVGGTFTDLVLTDDTGAVHTAKVPTTPVDPIEGIVRGVAEVLADAGVDAADVTRFVHGTTLATNVILQRTGAPVALVTTEGFADLLRLGRAARVEEDRYDLHFTPAPPPVDPRLTFEVRERIDASGAVLVPLTDPAIDKVVAQVAGEAPAGVAVCLLHSYARPDHEQAVASALRAALPGAFVACSSDVWPEMREYERAMTTVVSAVVGPVMSRYLDELGARLRAVGITGDVQVMDSAGDVMSATRAAAIPVATVESGGAAGVLAAGLVGRAAGAGDVISFDMGGTTAKAGIVRDGRPAITHDFQVGGKGSFGGARAGTGIPLKLPVVDLAEVGAGGGSIATVDARHPPGRTAFGGRRSRARLLRPRRHRTDRHRRRPRARLPRPRRTRRRRDAVAGARARRARRRGWHVLWVSTWSTPRTRCTRS